MAANDTPSPLGRGVRIENGDLEFRNGDLAMTEDRNNLLQDLQIALDTPAGSDPFNINYGFDYLGIFSAPTTVSVKKELIRLNIIKTVTQDPRVREVREIAFDDDPRFFEIVRDDSMATARDRRKLRREWRCVVVITTLIGTEEILTLEGTP
jgi:phage baseplate assembly protein W